MPLTPGQRLGPYEVVGVLGAGGMGEVYRARDTKLNRDVAIKVLSASFAQDTERLARFTREAQTLASLNHRNIGHLYGLEGQDRQDGGTGPYLVMELVEGEDLSQRIARGALPLDDALPIAHQIADALEAAHEQGIVHRDLKPANIKVKSDGTVKVLDFGLAKAVDPPGSSSAGDAANSPTLTVHATQVGTILGTAAYMAPEQAKGRAADRRSDIWAFGVVLYEMLTGRRAFEGDDISDILASVLKTEPVWTAVPVDTPPSVRRLLRRCLEKDPRRRLSSIGDARLELDEHEPAALPTTVAAPIAPAVRPSLLSRLWPSLAAVVVTAGIAAFLWPRSGVGDNALARLSILPPPGAPIYPDSAAVAISPDGTTVAFVVGNVGQSENQLWVRSIDSLEAHRLPAGDGARLPFWSPDNRRIGFFTGDKLKTIAVSAGRAEVLCDAPGARGAVWAPSNVIIFAPDAGGPLYRISANGGTPVPVTTLEPARKEDSHRFPAVLPDGDHFLYAALPGKNGQFNIFAGSLSDHSRTFVASMESAPVFAEPGWLLHARRGGLTAQPFDAKSLRLTGDPVSLDDAPASILDPVWSYTAGRPVSISSSGSLAYFSAPSTNTTVVWLDATGRMTGTLNVPPGYYDTVRISPDGAHAVLVRSVSPSESSLWLVDVARGGASPLSMGRGRNDAPIWSPDSARVIFSADRDGPMDFFIKNVGDASTEQPFYRSDVLFKSPTTWSSDGQWIVEDQQGLGTAQDIWLLPTSGNKELKPFLRGPATERGLATSPDGQWIAYSSNETGRVQLFVQAFPEPGHKVQVSQDGAQQAWWTRDGRQMVFVDDKLQSLWQVDVEPGATLRVGGPRQVATLPPNVTFISAMPDRQKFLAIVPERAGPGSVTVVRNWRVALEKNVR